MERVFNRLFGIVWIVMAIFLSHVIIQNPLKSGMAVGFFLLSVAMAHFYLSGQADSSSTAQHS